MFRDLLLIGAVVALCGPSQAAEDDRPQREKSKPAVRDRLLVTRALARQSSTLGEHSRQLENLAEAFAPSIKGGGDAALFEKAKVALAALRRDLKPLLPKGNRFEPLLNSSGYLDRLHRVAADLESLHRLSAQIEPADQPAAKSWRKRVGQVRKDLIEYAAIADEWDGEIGNERFELFELDADDLAAASEDDDNDVRLESNKPNALTGSAEPQSGTQRRLPSAPARDATTALHGSNDAPGATSAPVSAQPAGEQGNADAERESAASGDSSRDDSGSNEEVSDGLENIIDDESVDDLDQPEMDEEEPPAAPDEPDDP